MSAHYLVVDGHSVIFAWPELRRLHDQNRAAARKTLAESLQRLHDCTSWRVTLVLDGKLGSAAAPRPVRRVEDIVISYATADETADSIIERLVAASGRAAEILVITADEAERLTVESLGASAASPDWLRREMDLEHASLDNDLLRVNRLARWK